MDEVREQLKIMNRQFNFYMKHKSAMKNNLIAILDQTYPGINAIFDSPARPDGHQKWVDLSKPCNEIIGIQKKEKEKFRKSNLILYEHTLVKMAFPGA